MKIPPQALDIEQALLGSVLIEKDALYNILDKISSPDIFYSDQHQHIYRAILTLTGKSQPIDLKTVINQLRKDSKIEQAGGPSYLAELTAKINSAAHIEAHAQILLEKYFLREIIRNTSENHDLAWTESADPFNILDSQYQNLNTLTAMLVTGTNQTTSQIVVENLRDIETAMKSEHHITGVDTGFNKVNEITGGWQPGELVIIAARPGMGKTAFALTMARHISGKGGIVPFFSLEMSNKKLVQRLLSMEAEVDVQDMQRGAIRDYELMRLVSKSGNISDTLIIYDKPAITILEMKAKLNMIKRQYGLTAVFIDYLQLMTGEKGGNREQEISSISRNLKGIAKEFDVPVIALAQLSRSVELRGGDKKPILSDLRESGSIEQDADVVGFLYRPEYYGIDTDEMGGSTAGYAELIIAKNRNGSLNDIPLTFIGKFTKFTNFQTTAI